MPKVFGNEKFENVFAMLKGEPGTRKSTQALSFPLPQYWFSQDGKMNALRIPARLWNIDLTLVEYDAFKEFSAFEKQLEKLMLNCKYKTIIVDSTTTTGDTINMQTMKIKSGQQTKAGADKGLQVGGIKVNTFDDYKAENSGFTQMLATFKDLRDHYGCNIILISHVVGERKMEENSVSNAARIIITGGKSISGKIPAYCDEIYHFDVRRNVDQSKMPDYVAYTVPTGMDFARTALKLPTILQLNDKPLWKDFIEPAIKELNS